MTGCKSLSNGWTRMARVASPAFLLLLSILHYQQSTTSTINLVQAAYPPNLFNHSCLYAFMSDGGLYEVTENTPEGQRGILSKPNYDPKSSCIDPKTLTGSLGFNFEMSDNNFASMNIELELRAVPKEYNWEISRATLRAVPNNKEIFPSSPIELKAANCDMYAGLTQSFSCSSLILVNKRPIQGGARVKITLRHFQVQPFPEPDKSVFAPSRDCSTWLTLPQIMGFLLILFVLFTFLIGVYLLLDLGGHSSDLKFSKQGGMLMNQAQLDATKAD